MAKRHGREQVRRVGVAEGQQVLDPAPPRRGRQRHVQAVPGEIAVSLRVEQRRGAQNRDERHVHAGLFQAEVADGILDRRGSRSELAGSVVLTNRGVCARRCRNLNRDTRERWFILFLVDRPTTEFHEQGVYLPLQRRNARLAALHQAVQVLGFRHYFLQRLLAALLVSGVPDHCLEDHFSGLL